MRDYNPDTEEAQKEARRNDSYVTMLQSLRACAMCGCESPWTLCPDCELTTQQELP